MRTLRRTSFALSLPLVLAAALCAQSEVLTPQRVAEIQSVTAAAMSPDGKLVAYVVSVPRKPLVDEDGLPWTELRVLDVASGAARPFITGKQTVSNVQWTPDGKQIAFLAKRGEDKHNCLYAMPVDGGEARKLASLDEAISDYSFSPDATCRVALVASEAKPAAMKKREDKGFKQEIYEEDWRPSKIWVVRPSDAAGKPVKLEFDGSVHDVQWSPVDDRLAVSVTPTPLVDDEYMRIRVHVLDAGTGKLLAHCDNPGKLGEFAWSPDGKWIAMIAGVDIHDPAAECLLLAPASGGTPVDVLPNYPGKIESIGWKDGSNILYVASQGCGTVFERVEAVPGATPKTIWKGDPIITAMSVADFADRAAFVASTPAHPAELFTMQHGGPPPARRTDSNPWLKDVRLAKQEVLKFKARDGLELEGVLIRPLEEARGVRYPLIVYVHGGPEAHEKNGWNTGYSTPGQVAAARGFAVFHVNYRGSTGRGVAFSKSSQGDPAGKEFDDIVDAVDALIANGLVDKAKVGVTGGSYGGYATAWLATKYSERFAAGVMFVGISDKISKVGTTDIPDEEYFVHALHRPWEKWSFLLERSPIFHAGDCKTPLLILHGKDDPRVNPGQSREMYRHLKLRSRAPVRLVFYPGEGHGNRKSASRYDYNLRLLQWLEHYLVGTGGAMPPFELEYEPAAKPVEAGGSATAAGAR